MRAVICKEYGPPEDLVFEETADPAPGPGEVAVDVRAAGVGFVDSLYVQGLYQVKPPLPFIPGSEVAGIVFSIGEGVKGLEVGDPVLGMANAGAFAEKTLMAANACVRKPEAMGFPAAAGFLVAYCTALFAFRERGDLKAGETVLVLGAAGSVGLAAIDVAKAMGARVIAAASTPEKLAACEAQGADALVDYTDENWRAAVEEAAGGGVDLVYDPVGGDFSNTALRILRPWGRFLVIGFAAGAIPKIPLNLALLKQCQIVGVDWGGWVRGDGARNGPLLEQLTAWVDAGQVSPASGQPYSLASAAVALRDLMERRVVGKAVLVP